MNKIAATLLVSLAATTLAVPALAQPTLSTQPPAAVAPDPKTSAAARDLLEAMNYRATTAAMMKQMIANMPAMMRGSAQNQIRSSTTLTEQQKTDKLAEVDRMVPQATAAMSKVLEDPKLADEMMGEMVPLYARHFTADEMKELATFYRSPVGRKSLQVMPQLLGEGMQFSQRLVAPRINKVMQELNEKQAQNQAKK
ncbi:hypothetical protein IP91_02682 [Pseudoduganella lurida]|uniref:DUF2059 domain-containing protein n=1 Tax=Pseudoduganella lurida TaxID=1036180 RepID=A0A562R898_9BURK|nr:DUF2059 domain-containing protein [Pseudoduganella lurida]TWI65275.1 hypothetical protein IP91_02682 [Pseudoduganella lurida]